MAEIIEQIQDGLEDFGDNVKRTFKKKPFLIACAGVGAVALFVWWRKQNSGDGDSGSYYEGSPAIGYAGYPTVNTGADDTTNLDYYLSQIDTVTSQYNATIESMQSEFDSSISDLSSEYEKNLAGMQSQYDESMKGLESTVTTLSSQVQSQQKEIEYNNAIAQMKANSELYNALSGSANASTREALHKENMEIAEKYGLTYEAKSGNYFTNTGTVAYTTTKQDAQVIEGKKKASSSGSGSVSTSTQKVTFDSNVDYQAKINEAVKNGASSETVEYLKAQRQAKINAVYGGVDPDTKK